MNFPSFDFNPFRRKKVEEQDDTPTVPITITETPPEQNLEDSQNNSGTSSEDFQNSEKTVSEEAQNLVRSPENALERQETPFLDQSEHKPEFPENSSEFVGNFNLEGENNSGTNEDGINSEEIEPIELPHDISISTADPLAIEEPISSSDSPGNSTSENPKNIHKTYGDKLRTWGITGIDFMDDMKAVLCVAIGGGHKHEYKADKHIKKTFFEATEELLKTTEIKPPTPMQVFLMALAAMTLPSLGLAGYRKFLAPKMEEVKDEIPQSNPSDSAAQQAPSDKVGYAHTKEVKEGRTRFSVFANGMYQYDSSKNYIGVDDAYETPSPEIQKLIDEGRTSAQIKETVYGNQ